MRTPYKLISSYLQYRAIAFLVINIFLAVSASSAWSNTTVKLRDEEGDIQPFYRGSYALLVGVSRYTNGWQNLDQIPGELRLAKEALESHGFEVTLELERTSAQDLFGVYREFINQYGYNKDNRLVFIFSGHGHTWVDGNQGYLVASDAPKPAPNGFPGASFLSKTIQISQMLEWARQMTAKHALFLFDSCFSGTIFQTKGPDNAPKPSKFSFTSASRPVRQFITAGSADETVPAKSVFMPAFVDAITLGEGDYTRDGLVTGNELGLYLEHEVQQFSEQSPQFGRHPIRDLAKGNFVFVLDSRNINSPDETIGPVIHDGIGTSMAKDKESSNAENLDASSNASNNPDVNKLIDLIAFDIAKKNLTTPKGNNAFEKIKLLESMSYHDLARKFKEAVIREYEKLIDGLISGPIYADGKEGRINSFFQRIEVVDPKFSRKNFYDSRNLLKPKEPEMILVKAGCFLMGSPIDDPERFDKEIPQKEVCVENDFFIGKYEVTAEEVFPYIRDIEQKEAWSFSAWSGPRYPASLMLVSRRLGYTKWLSEKTGKTYRLPTEAEWEYVARAGTTTAYNYGNSRSLELSNLRDNSLSDMRRSTFEVGSYPPNQWGVYDMHGNVNELTCSYFYPHDDGSENRCHLHYEDLNEDFLWKNPKRMENIGFVVKGGSYSVFHGKSAGRGSQMGHSSAFLEEGFRLVRDLPTVDADL